MQPILREKPPTKLLDTFHSLKPHLLLSKTLLHSGKLSKAQLHFSSLEWFVFFFHKRSN